MNSEPLFNELIGVMAVITMIPVLFIWLEKRTKWKIFNILPAIIWIFLTPIFLSNLNVIPRSTAIYTTFRSFAVPMFIVLMLLDINIRQSLRVAWRGAAVLVLGAFGIVIGAVISFYIFREGLPPDTWRGYGALAGSWIGGTGNLAAVAESLDTPGEMVGMVVLVDNFVYVLYFPLILTCKRWAKSFNRFTGVSQEQIDHIAQADAEIEKKAHEVHFRDVLVLMGFGFTAIFAANQLAAVFPVVEPVFTQNTWAILLVTTFGIGLSATPLKNVPGTEPLAMGLVYIYMTMLGAQADLSKIGGAQWFLAAGFVCITVHLVFIVIGARLFRIDVSMAATASVA
ncbi:MAG: DUF819 family protein, partial [Gemmatimonadota bacterium]|nr:DUF819 family protein [Gemmatimonadota bacterium]